MSSFDDQIRLISDMFEGRFSLLEIERVFHMNDNDSSLTVDQLFASQASKSEENQQNAKSSSNSSKQTKKKKDPSKIRTDKEAFECFCEEYSILSKPDLTDIWQLVTREYWQDKIDLKTKYSIAKENACQRIQWLVDGPPVIAEENKTSDETMNLPNPEHDFQQYSQLFQGVIPFKYLQIIWNNLDYNLSNYEKQQIGVLYAMDMLEQDQLTNSELYPTNEATLQTAIQQQEKARIAAAQTKSRMKVTIKHGKNSQNPSLCSPQQMVKNMVADLFADSTVITAQLIDELLILYMYDIDTVIQELYTRALQHGSFLRENMSYAKIAQKNSAGGGDAILNNRPIITNDGLPDIHYNYKPSPYITPGSGSGKISYSSVASRPAISSPTPTNQTTTYTTVSSSSTRGRSQKQQSQQLRFGEYFLAVFRRNNPDIRVELQPMTGELKYEGSDHFQSVTQYYRPVVASSAAVSTRTTVPSLAITRQRDEAMHMISIALDFHNLPVLQVLQIVGSAVDYYRIEQRAWIMGNTNIKRIMLKFVVGKGLHSPGGVAKLGPAVQKFLRERNETNVVVYEGEILLVLQLLKK